MTANYVNDLDPVNAIDHNQDINPDGVLARPGSGDCAVSIGSGSLGASDTLAVASGTVLVDAAEVTVGAQNVSIDAADSQPRKDVVYVDANGTAQVAKGTPEAPLWSELLGEQQRALDNAYRPAPSDMTAITGTTLAIITVPEDASSITTAERDDRRTFAKRDRVDSAVVNSDEQSISDTASIASTGLPVVDTLSRRYEGAVQSDDGTHYALAYDGTNLHLYKGASIGDLAQHNTLGTLDSKKIELHLTAAGTLLVGYDGQMKRSTDGGATFTDVYALPAATTAAWSITESSAGSLVATQSSAGVGLFKSTDDGQTWTQIADATTFPDFPDHVHRARYHPVNDYLIVTGGDGAANKGFYRSTDDGATFDYLVPANGTTQWVGIGCHPTDGQTYFLAADDGGEGPIVKITDGGTNTLAAWEIVHVMDIEQSPGAQGSFEIATVDDPAGRSFYLATSCNQAENFVWASSDLTGRNWRIVGSVGAGVSRTYSATKTQGAHEQILSPGTVPTIVNSDRSVDLTLAGDYHFGTDHSASVDRRQTQGHIQLGEDSVENYRVEWLGVDGTIRMLRAQEVGSDELEVAYGNNRFYLNNETAGTFPWWVDISSGFINANVYTRYRSGNGFGCIDGENLAGQTGNFNGEMRRDDGTNSTLFFGYVVWNGAAWERPDGTTFV